MIEDYSETDKKLSLILQNKRNEYSNQIYQMALKYIVNGSNLEAVISNLCESIDNNTYSMCCIMLHDKKEEKISSYFSPNLPRSFFEALKGLKIEPVGCSSSVAAFKKKMVSSSILKDTGWFDYRGLAIKHSIGSCYSFPFFTEQKELLGTIDFYYRVENRISPEEILILESYSQIVGIIIDTYHKRINLNDTNQIDTLTNLKNRQQFFREIQKAASLGMHYYILFLDIDHFRLINQYYSFEIADYVLVEVANRIKLNNNRSIVGRWNGDQFVIFIPEATELQCIHYAKQLLEKLEEIIICKGEQILITCSIGISKYNEKDRSFGVKPAEAAMKIAKKKGTQRWYIYEESFQGSTIEEELAKAITQGEFELYYQPQLEIEEKKIFGVEALLRWKHPIYGSVSPQQFIQVAEEQGLMGTLGDLVIKKSFQQVKKLISMCPGIRVSINISVIQLNKPTFFEKLLDEIRRHGILANHVIIEITETAAINNMVKIRQVIEKVRSLGIQVAIDDFGTAYSSLKYIKDLPCDILKIDKSFVRDIELDPKNLQIVNLMVELGKRTNIKVSAEGVETKEQMNLLKELGCDIIQGFYVSKPLSFDELSHFLKKTDDGKLKPKWLKNGKKSLMR